MVLLGPSRTSEKPASVPVFQPLEVGLVMVGVRGATVGDLQLTKRLQNAAQTRVSGSGHSPVHVLVLKVEGQPILSILFKHGPFPASFGAMIAIG